MIWLLRDIDLFSTLLRAANLSLEALLLGGIIFLLAIAIPAGAGERVDSLCLRGIRKAAVALAFSQIITVALATASLLADSDQHLRDAFHAGFFWSGMGATILSLLLWWAARARRLTLFLPASLLLLAATVSTSHAAARLDDRWFLLIATALHHLGTAAWIGAMPFFLLALPRAFDTESAKVIARRYSAIAVASVVVLVLAGFAMAYFYVASWKGLYGTSYGILLLAKIYLLLVVLAMGAGNWLLVRRLNNDPQPLLRRLGSFAEAEVGLGFTIILAAASMSSQPPSVDVSDQVSLPVIAARMHPEPPRLHSPNVTQLTPPTSLETAVKQTEFQAMGSSDETDRKWSEYNHHWAGLVVIAAGLLAFLSRFRGMRWARFWPLTFAGLSVFILLRADPENWPLGPRPFWASFSSPDVLQHRVAALVILLFAAFECAVQAGKLHARWAAMIFPAMCAMGAVILLTHNHAASNSSDELLASLNHIPIALFGATAGWLRWLELRLPRGRAALIAGRAWPLFLTAAGLVLLNYREI